MSLAFDDGTPLYSRALGWFLVFLYQSTNMGMLSIVSQGDLRRKIEFLNAFIVFSSILGAAINFLINLIVVFLFALINQVEFGLHTLVIIPLSGVLVLAMGCALMPSLFVISDIGPIWEPIIYSLNFLLDGKKLVAKIMMLNPIAPDAAGHAPFHCYSVNVRGWDHH